MKYNKRIEAQVNQLCHLLGGGTLTKRQVTSSGLGEWVLIEQRHLAWRLQSAQRKLDLAMDALDQISVMPRQARARRIAQSTATFIRELEKAVTRKAPSNGLERRREPL